MLNKKCARNNFTCWRILKPNRIIKRKLVLYIRISSFRVRLLKQEEKKGNQIVLKFVSFSSKSRGWNRSTMSARRDASRLFPLQTYLWRASEHRLVPLHHILPHMGDTAWIERFALTQSSKMKRVPIHTKIKSRLIIFIIIIIDKSYFPESQWEIRSI